MAQNASTGQSTTLSQKMDIAAGIAKFLMMPVFLFLRRKAGYRFLNPTHIFAMALILLIFGTELFAVAVASSLGGAAPIASNPYAGQPAPQSAADVIASYVDPIIFIAFAWLVILTTLFQRRRRWKEIKTGILWHSYTSGLSWFSFLPIADYNIKRFVDPAVCIIAGLLIAFPLHLLPFGLYIILSGLCVFIFSAYEYEQQLNAMLDMRDSLIDSEVISENAAYYSEPNAKPRPISETAGISTGIGADIQLAIEKRRARQAALPSTNTGSLPVVATTPAVATSANDNLVIAANDNLIITQNTSSSGDQTVF